MKKALISVLIISAIIISACAGPKDKSEEEKLRQQLKKWESFDSEGIAEVSYKSLAIRKMFSAAKNGSELRFDLFDGGLLGSAGEPLLTMYLGDYVAVKSPFIPMLELLDLTPSAPLQSLKLSANADSLVAFYGERIIRDKKLELNGVTINFNKDYLLDSVWEQENKTQMKALYNSKGDLSELVVTSIDNISLRMSFDKIEYVQPQIIPLPKPELSFSEDALKGLNNLNLESLLKDFLQYKKERQK
ncbi:MAG TPA: hypothetical protein PLW08_02870 [Candidatus Cloacimonas acidaminovorans]|nr:hypothetical protein [Candidatus Cloacimonas acidaminovorans]